MIIETIVFYLLAVVTVAAGVMVIASRNPVQSVLFLILAFFNAAGLFVLIGAEFIAMILVIVYVGAVAVLFLFVVMMLDINFIKLREGFLQYLPFGVILGIVLIIELGILFLTKNFSEMSLVEYSLEPQITSTENTKLIGSVLYTKYFYLFQLSGLILLVAMIGSITLTLRKKGKSKKQIISNQNNIDASQSLIKKKIKLGEGIR